MPPLAPPRSLISYLLARAPTQEASTPLSSYLYIASIWCTSLAPPLSRLLIAPLSAQEDEKLVGLVAKMGPTSWSQIAQSLPGRIGKQCRERWHNQLNPDIRRDGWDAEEDNRLVQVR